MVKFGQLLLSEKDPSLPPDKYVDYELLKRLLEEARVALAEVGSSGGASFGVSMSVPKSNYRDKAIDSRFYEALEAEMVKVDDFMSSAIESMRSALLELEDEYALVVEETMDPDRRSITQSSESTTLTEREHLKERVDGVAANFLALEKFQNVNFIGFQKILKKHDKVMGVQARSLYTMRLKAQTWVKSDYSDIIVRMSQIYSSLRKDSVFAALESESQTFFRNTRKYWVRMEDISSVKYTVLQHLPVFLQKDMGNGKTDSQLVNSVYLDNEELELYTGRLEKTHEAIALRFRWYGDGRPEDGKVFVERKTHRDSTSVLNSEKERFVVSEPAVRDILDGTFDVSARAQKMRDDGKSDSEVEAYRTLASEVCEVVTRRRLVPYMRTQYMRTAFQVPYDASVRVSMDTNLTLFLDKTEDTIAGRRWYRDPSRPVPANEMNVFPRAVVEIKLQLKEKDDTPAWLVELISSGKLVEKHKFSKFVHGCATILPMQVSAFPYWIDEPSLQQSIQTTRTGESTVPVPMSPSAKDVETGAVAAAVAAAAVAGGGGAPSTAAVAASKKPKAPKAFNTAAAARQGNPHCLSFCGFHMLSSDAAVTEPKIFMANERTFITWLSMAALLTSISMAILAFSQKEQYSQIYGLVLLPVALLFDVYALRTYIWRGRQIRSKRSSSWGDSQGPFFITSALVVALLAQLVAKIYQLSTSTSGHKLP